MLQNNKITKIGWQHSRWPLAFLGLVLLLIGQIQISSSKIPATTSQIGQWLNTTFHLDIPGLDNLLTGFPILLLGLILFLISLRGGPLLPKDKVDVANKLFDFRFLLSSWPGILSSLAILGTVLWTLATRDYSLWMTIGWLVSLLLIISIIASWDIQRGINLSLGVSRRDVIWLVGLLIIGVVVCTYQLGTLPDSLAGDEVNFWNAARDLASGTVKQPIFALGANNTAILSTYFQAMIIKVFGFNLWAWRFSSVLSGLSTLVPLYLLAKETFNRKVAIATSSALIFNPYFLAFTRLGFTYIQALVVTVFAIFFVYIGLKKDSHFYLILAGCATGLGVYSFFPSRISILILLIFVLIMWISRRVSFRKSAFAILLLIIGGLIITSPSIVYSLAHNSGASVFKFLELIIFNSQNATLFYPDQKLFALFRPISYHDLTLFFNPTIYFQLLVRGLLRTLLAFQKPGLSSGDFISSSLAGTVGVFFFLVGFSVVLVKNQQVRNKLVIIWFASIVFFLSSIFSDPPQLSYMVVLIPVMALITGIGLTVIVETLGMVHAHFEKHRYLILVILCIAIGAGGLVDYFVVMPAHYLPQADQIMSSAIQNARDEYFFYIYSNPDEQLFQPFYANSPNETIPFTTISIDSLNPSIIASSHATKNIFFYSPDLADRVVPVLQAGWGNKYHQKTFYSQDGAPILSVGMNTPFVFARDLNLISILKASYLHTSFLILLILLLGALLIIGVVPRKWVLPFPGHLKRLELWFNSPLKSALPSETSQELMEVFFDQPENQQPIELPIWADQIFPAPMPKKLDGISADLKRVNLAEGNDYYIKIHFPKVNIQQFGNFGKIEFELPTFKIPNHLLLLISILLAFIAQIFIHNSYPLFGIILYLFCITGLIVWIRFNPKWTNVFGFQWRISPLAEKLLMGLVFVISAFFRFYDLSYRVYGIDGDEVKWTIQSWYSTILMVPKGDFISHYVFMPVSYWIRSAFLHIFGLNYISPRFESATLSLLTILFLYLLVRRITGSKPIALFSSILYSSSYLGLNFAHQAMGETTPEVWIVGCFLFLVLTLQERKVWQFQITGILFALGMLTFESFLPSPVVLMVYLGFLGLYEVIRKITSARNWLKYLLIVAWPMILAYLMYTQGILNVRRGYDLGSLMQFSGNGSNISGIFLFLLRNVTHLFQTIFSHIVWTDSILYWGGSLINVILLPFVVVGLIYNLWNIRRPYYILIPLWFVVHVAVGPLALGAVYPRVLFTVLGPLMIWGAMGLWVFFGALRAGFNNRNFKLALPIFIFVILAIFINDYHIFTSTLFDAIDNQKRHELATFTEQSAGNVPMIIYTYLPKQVDPLDVETSVILLSVAGKTHLGEEAANLYKQVEFGQVLATLWEDRKLSSLDLFFDKTTYLQDQRDEALKIILNCYPNAILARSGKYFSVYHFNTDSLAHPACFEGLPPDPTSPQNGTTVLTGAPIRFAWNNNGDESTSYSFSLDRKVAGTFLIEVENTFSGPHWVYSSGFVNDFSGAGFILDDWLAGDANYTFTLPENGQYRIWIRSFKRRVNDQHNFITINGKVLEFASDTNTLNEWVWEDLGVYDRNKGPLPMVLSRTYGVDEQYSVFIDSILITSDLNDKPDQVKVWEALVKTSEIHSPANEYTLSEILAPGDYRWKVRIYNADFLVDSSGGRGIDSPSSTFTVVP